MTKNAMSKISRYQARTGQRGAALIEFALVLPILVLITFLVVDLSRAFYVKNLLDQAAREGARRLAVGSTDEAAVSITKYVASASGLDSTRVTVVALNLDPSGPQQVRMTVTTQFNWIFPGLLRFLALSSTDPTLTGTCAMRREYL